MRSLRGLCLTALVLGALGCSPAAAQQQVTGSVIGGLLGADTVIIDGTIVSADFSTGAVDSAAILDDAITSADIGTDAVTADELADLSVDTAALQDGSVTSAKIAADAVTSTSLADDAVDTGAIQDGAVTAAKLANDSVTSAAIAANAVTTSEIADGAVTFAKLSPDVQNRITAVEQGVDRLNGGVAMAMAMANAPVVEGGHFSLSLGTSVYQGAVAGALKVGVLPTDRLSLTGSVAYTSKQDMAVGAGIGFGW